MKIVIYDTRHFEMVNVLFRIFNSSENQILFFISPVIYNKLQAASENDLKKHAFVVENANEVSSGYFKRCEAEIKKFNPDFVICNTIDKDYKDVWAFLKTLSQPYFVTVHNINTWLNPPFTLNRIALSNYFFRKKIVAKLHGLIVQEELFIDYIKKNNLYKKSVFAIPHTLKEFESEKINNEKIVVAIPGAIDGVRRDIDLALNVIEEVHKKSNRFRFVFLGQVLGYLGEPIWERAKALQKQGLDIAQFYNPTNNKEFDEQMKKCDIVFLPLNVNTKFEGIPEVYGTTKVTGVIYDMMRFSKPGIVPSAMVVPPTMVNSMLSYKNKSELIEMILKLSENGKMLNELKANAETNSIYYTIAEIRKRVLPQIQKNLLFLKA